MSPSTVFRYFATKEDLVVNDDYDPIVFAAFEAQPPELNLIQAWRRAMRDAHRADDRREDVETQLDRGRLLLSVPELWGATLHGTQETLEIMMNLSAERVGCSPDDPAVRATVGAIFGVLLIAALDWVQDRGPATSWPRLDEALAQLDEGLLR